MRKIVIYFLLVLASIIAAQMLYVFTKQEQKDSIACGATLHYKLDSLKTNYKTIYFGESSNFTYAKTDTLQNSIAEFVSSYANREIGVLQQGALHAGIYRTLIERINEDAATKQLIVTVNLRSFGINWIESKLETNLARAQVLYSNYPALLKKFMVEFKWYDRKEEFQRSAAIKAAYKHQRFSIPSQKYTNVRDWDGVVFHAGLKNSKGLIDRDTTTLACHFIKNYAFEIDDGNVRLQDFEAIADYCKQNHIQLFLHILPENFERAKILIGEDLCYLMRKNCMTIKSKLAAKATIIDNSELLGMDNFIDLDWPTEHYNQAGRQLIAKKIAEVLQK